MFHAACVPGKKRQANSRLVRNRSNNSKVAHTTALRRGEASVVMRRFDLDGFLSSIEKFGINTVVIVPPIVITIIMSPITKKYSLRNSKAVSCGAAPLGKCPFCLSPNDIF